jgi:hypothetical protein
MININGNKYDHEVFLEMYINVYYYAVKSEGALGIHYVGCRSN